MPDPSPPAATPVTPTKKSINVKYLVTNVAATLNLTAGVLGLVFPETLPALAPKPVAFTLIAIGIGLEIWAFRLLLATRRAEDAAEQGSQPAAGETAKKSGASSRGTPTGKRPHNKKPSGVGHSPRK